METLYDFFAKPKDPKRYNGIRLALASPEEIASTIVFLSSERASYVSGAAWGVDGGTVPVII